MTTPNVLASRYASPEVARIWSPEHKIVLERRLWIAVLKAQKDLGVETPDGVIEAYESVIDHVDLASIAEREKVTRHDVKARIEEFAALAGTEHIHKGMTSRDLTENVEQLQIKASLELMRDRDDRHPGPPRPPRRPSTPSSSWPAAATMSQPRRRPSASGSRRSPTSCFVAIERLDDLIARYPLRGIKGPVGTSQDQLDLLGGDEDQLAELEQRVARHLGFDKVLTSVGQVYPRSLDYDVVTALVQLVAAPSNLATTIRLMAGNETRHRGLPARPGRLERDAAQDEHPLVRARQRPRGHPARVCLDGRRARRRPVERGRRVVLGRPPRRAARCVLRRRRTVRDVPDGARRVRRRSPQ